MKILKTCGSYSYGGIEIYILRTIEALIENRHQVHLACPRGSMLYRKALELKMTVFPIMEKGIKRLKSIYNIGSIIRKNNYDIIHTHLSNDLWTLVSAIKISGLSPGLILSKCMSSGISKKDLFHRYLYRNVDIIIAVSSFIKANVIKTCPVSETKVVVINDAVSTDRFDPSRYNRSEIRKSLGFSENEIVIGMIGRMTPGKGHDIFFEAVKSISSKYRIVKFILVGSASYGENEFENELHSKAQEIGVKDKIIFTGFKEDVAYYLSAMDILAFPSREESFGGTLLEAMAMKVPQVAFSSGGVTDIVLHGETGLLAERGNEKDFTEKLITLIENEALRKAMAEKCRKIVMENFEMSSNIRKVESLYEQIIRKG